MPDRRVVRLGDVADVRWGDTKTTKASYVPAGYMAYSASGPDGFLPHADYSETGIVLSAIGAQCGRVWLARGSWSCIKNTIRILGRDDRASIEYLYWLLSLTSPWPIRGSAQPFISQQDARRVVVELPSLEEQMAACEVLRALEDKIAVNERIVESSDELRHLLFEDFKTRRAELIQQCPLTSVADFVNGRAFTKDATGTGRMVVRIAELNSGPGGSTVYNDMEVPERHLARAGDVLFAWSGSLTVARWYRQEAIINQHIFKVIPNDGMPTWLAYELVLSKLAEFKAIAADKATTMGHIQRRHLEEAVVAPTADAIALLDRQLGPLWDRALAAEQESLALAELRDTLLPGLISGAIRVRDAEKAVEDAT